MRTDSTNVVGVGAADGAGGDQRQVRTGVRAGAAAGLHARRSKGAQEAHEAIRPTSPHRDPASVKQFLSPPAVPALSADLAAIHGQPDGAGDS